MIEVYGNSIQIRQAIDRGYVEIPLNGDIYIADFSYPSSMNRRGRVQGIPPGTISPALTCVGITGLYILEEESED